MTPARRFFICLLGLGLLQGACALLQGACASNKSSINPDGFFSFENPSTADRVDELFILTREDLAKRFPEIEQGLVPRLVDEHGQPVPSQRDDLDGDGTWDELAFLSDVESGASVRIDFIFVEPQSMPNYSPRTQVHLGARPSATEPVEPIAAASFNGNEIPAYQVYQTDGPSWENDLVGYRLYLDGRNTRDIFGKRTDELVLHGVGLSAEGAPVDNYHVLADWGRDIFECGNTLGAGSLAMLSGEELVRLGRTAAEAQDNIETTSYRLINSGPVRGIFEVKYSGWHVGDETYDLRAIISIWPGSYAYQTQLWLADFEGERSLVVGLANSNNSQPVTTETYGTDYAGVLIHDKQTYFKEYYLGTALLVPEDNLVKWGEAPKNGDGIVSTSYAVLRATSEEPITYWVYAGWELQDNRFLDSDYFGKMVGESVARLGAPIQINITSSR